MVKGRDEKRENWTSSTEKTAVKGDPEYWETTVRNVLAACLATRLEKAGIRLDPVDVERMIVLQDSGRGGFHFHWQIDSSSLAAPQIESLQKAFPGFRDSSHPLGPSMLERIMVDKLEKLYKRKMEGGLITSEHKLGTFYLGAGNEEMYSLTATNETDLVKGLHNLQAGFKLKQPIAIRDVPNDTPSF